MSPKSAPAPCDTDEMSLAHRRFGVLAAGVAAVLLSGCTAAQAPQAAPPPTLPEPVTISGSGTQTSRLTIPDGAESLRVRLACTVGDFQITANTDLLNDRRGRCGGMTTVVIPLPTTAWMEVTVTVDPAESLVGTLEFSDRPLDVDPETAKDCAALGRFYGLFQDAEVAYQDGAIDRAAWRAGIDDALAALEETTPSPMIEPQVAVLSEWIGAVEEPGFWMRDTTAAVGAAHSLAGQVCTDNGSTIGIPRQYGG